MRLILEVCFPPGKLSKKATRELAAYKLNVVYYKW